MNEAPISITEIKEYLASEKDVFNKRYLDCIIESKVLAIKDNDEVLANTYWCLHKIAQIQSYFLTAYSYLKSRDKHREAWRLLDIIDLNLSNLRPHFCCDDNKYFLLFIGNIIHEYQKLFPYVYFLSREGIIKKEVCTICNKPISLRSSCGHEAGNLYMGEMCCRKATDYTILGISLVRNPFDKYTVIGIPNREYNYVLLDTLMDTISSPYDRFYIETEDNIIPKYSSVKKSKSCPCDSGKTYRRCCLGTKRELMTHYKVTHLDNPNVESLPMITGSTWK